MFAVSWVGLTLTIKRSSSIEIELGLGLRAIARIAPSALEPLTSICNEPKLPE
jgi:hypothetical protein